MNYEIIPAVIAKTQEEVDERINKVKDYCGWIQLDVMDGKFVENNSLDFDFNLPATECKYEAHLMVEDPKDWLDKNLDKVDVALVHIESCKKCNELIDYIKSKNVKAGLAINPETSIEDIKDYLDILDQVLVMTVNPGFYGSPFLPEMLGKVIELRGLKPELEIEVDGGITLDTISDAFKADANRFVSGSCIMKSSNVKETIEQLRNQLK